jgi:hypothetical protein
MEKRRITITEINRCRICNVVMGSSATICLYCDLDNNEEEEETPAVIEPQQPKVKELSLNEVNIIKNYRKSVINKNYNSFIKYDKIGFSFKKSINLHCVK